MVGDLEEGDAFRLAERYFGPIPGGNKAMVPRVSERPLVETIRIVLKDRVELDRVYLMWPTSASSTTTMPRSCFWVTSWGEGDRAVCIAGWCWRSRLPRTSTRISRVPRSPGRLESS